MSEGNESLKKDVQDAASRSADVDTLVAALHSRSGAVRERAREALVDAGKPAVDPLIEALRDADCQVQWEAAKALGEIGDPAAAPELANQLDHPDFDVRWLAAEGLIAIGPEAVGPVLTVLTERGDDQLIRNGAHHVLRDLAQQDLQKEVGPVLEALEGPDADVQAPRAARVALYGSAGVPAASERD